ncbi:hypothetical protein GGR28_001294 [Lewinella aquimaris]|uniref:VOC domain-containing protein n=1 Tax=Neolewinella aquimaris TaxID=1835722 RepID=A0A840E0C9_9BACT|nr:VOC family protein [Neolewinella aquimaris]MBB4078681.1 hypothetical protein [Neolewinella aquimaris]
MTKQVWLNLPVADVATSRTFFRAIGFRESPRHAGNPQLAGFLIGEHDFIVMLFPESEFKNFTQLPVADTKQASEVLINIDAESPEEVDKMRDRVAEAGGHIYTPPTLVEGFMYLFCFADPDGHRWCVMHMDEAKLAGR